MRYQPLDDIEIEVQGRTGFYSERQRRQLTKRQRRERTELVTDLPEHVYSQPSKGFKLTRTKRAEILLENLRRVRNHLSK